MVRPIFPNLETVIAISMRRASRGMTAALTADCAHVFEPGEYAINGVFSGCCSGHSAALRYVSQRLTRYVSHDILFMTVVVAGYAYLQKMSVAGDFPFI